MRSLDPNDFEALTFDCYGTLVDWLSGERAAVAAMPSLGGVDAERLVRDRHRFDFELVQGEYRPYSEVLRRSMSSAAELQGRRPTAEELAGFARSMADWPPFAESRACLRHLAGRYRLAILSNVETETLRASVRALDAPFAELVTAEQLSSYKPARAHFDAALERLGLPREQVLHVAQSIPHDHAPAQALGWRTAWIDRQGEAPAEDARPDLVVPNLTELCRFLLPGAPTPSSFDPPTDPRR